MIGLDHEEKRGSPYCPLIDAPCDGGWHKKMGRDDAGKPRRCAAWRGLPLMDVKADVSRIVHACAVYEWPSFQAFEASGLAAQTRASVDKQATEKVGRSIAAMNQSFCNAAQASLEMKERALLLEEKRLVDAGPKHDKSEGSGG